MLAEKREKEPFLQDMAVANGMEAMWETIPAEIKHKAEGGLGQATHSSLEGGRAAARSGSAEPVPGEVSFRTELSGLDTIAAQLQRRQLNNPRDLRMLALPVRRWAAASQRPSWE